MLPLEERQRCAKKRGEAAKKKRVKPRMQAKGFAKSRMTLKRQPSRTMRPEPIDGRSERGGDTDLLMREVFTPLAAATAKEADTCTEGVSSSYPGSQDSSLGLGQAQSPENERSVVSDRVSLGDISQWLESRLDDFLTRHCKTMPTGRLFPLPSSSYLLATMFPQVSPSVLSLLRCLVCSLNSLNGEGMDGPERASEYQTKVLSGLLEDCTRVESWVSGDPSLSWSDFFKVKGIDYKGEEVLTAQQMRWENVAPALPKEVGSVPLEDVLGLGCRHYVLNFEEYLLEVEDQEVVKPPKVMVPPDDWPLFCRNLLDLGVFAKVHEDDVYRVKGQKLLNGLFGVSKHEHVAGVEVMRVIMNLVPANAVCRGIEGDVSTLPAWAGMTPLHLQPHEDLLISSEDVRAFFYIFKIPQSWQPFMAFNRPLPPDLCGERPGNWYPCSAVLPMGFKNSVALAQAVHRYIVNQALYSIPGRGGESELRKDKTFPSTQAFHRVYLDNFDELEKASKEMAAVMAGKPSPLTLGLQEVYSDRGVPRHPKKGVARQLTAEVQGAIVDGTLGIAYPKPDKVLRYVQLAVLLLKAGVSSQKQMQVVGGGLVYLAMFRRPLLGSLNHLWEFIVGCNSHPPGVKFKIPPEVTQEISRFIGLVPLAYMNFRCQISEVVTASDASESGGGVTASVGLSPMGAVASQCSIRGDVVDVVEPGDIPGVLTIGLFDGIGALRVAADALG
eukprot:s3214_g9.t1